MSKQGEVVCLYCGNSVAVSKMNGQWIRQYHHGKNKHMCPGSKSPVIDSTVILKDKVNA